MQAQIQHQDVEEVPGRLQRLAFRGHRRREDLLRARRPLARPQLTRADQTDQPPDRRAGLRWAARARQTPRAVAASRALRRCRAPPRDARAARALAARRSPRASREPGRPRAPCSYAAQLHRRRAGLRSPRRRRPQPAPAPACTAGLLCDLLWSDPELDVTGWAENDRGVSYTFGADVVGKFLSKHDFDLVVRAHQVVEDGYEFFADRQLVTIFSAPNYCGEFDNAGAVMAVDESLMCSFRILKPDLHRR